MKNAKIKSVTILVTLLGYLSSCTSSPIGTFKTFSRYKSDDGILILDCEVSSWSGYGKLKLDDKYEDVKWSSDWNGYLLTVGLDDGNYIYFQLDFIDLGGVYSKDVLSIGKGKTYDGDERLLALTDWSSRISKERDLRNEEIDARYFYDACFSNKKLGLKLNSDDTIGQFSDRKYVLSLEKDKTFVLRQTGYSDVSSGTYTNTKEELKLTFERDAFFHLNGETMSFDVKKK